MAAGEDGARRVLARWSERKLRAGQPADSGSRPEAAETEKQATVGAPGDGDDSPVLTDSDMPPLDSLDSGSDYSGFFSPGVSEALRRKALSKLFHSPHLNLVDGLDDYAEDFATFAPLGDIVTAEMRHRMDQAAKRLLAEDAEEENVACAQASTPVGDEDGAQSTETPKDLERVPDNGEELV